MSQPSTYQVPPHPSGLEMRMLVNQILLALVSQNGGPMPPPETYPLMMWGDTTTQRLRMRTSTNDGWIDLGPLNDFLSDIRTLVNTTAATKVNRGGDAMTGSLTLANANLHWTNSAAQQFGYLGAYGGPGAAGSGIGFVDSTLSNWNMQIGNDGQVNTRNMLTVRAGGAEIWGRLLVRQPGAWGELALYSQDTTKMWLRGRTAGGGMEWINDAYNAVVASMDNAGTFQSASEVWSAWGGGRLSGTGDVYGATWGGWLSTWVTNTYGNKADRYANCQYNSGLAEIGGVETGIWTSDFGNPWVMIGLRITTSQDINRIYPRGIILRNN